MKKILFVFLISIFSSPIFSQNYTLEQIDFSPIGNAINFNTFPLGINNKGFVCGYYQNTVTNDTTGFVITPEGKVLQITNAITGAGSYGIKAVSINDSNMVLVNYLDAGGVSRLHKCLVNNNIIVNDWAITNNIGQTNIKAFHYNNKGDITGWYQGVGNRWMFTLHDGTPPAGFLPWQAWRYNIYVNPNYTYYNTMAGAMDTNRVLTGFYIDGAFNYPFIYEELYAMFYVLNGSTWCHPWGKNNSGKIVGEYKNGGGIVNAFIASPTFTPGQPNSGQLNLTSLANIFHSNTIQSAARAINDKDEIVGSYIDPTNGNWVGFMYRPNGGDYHINNYTFNKHVWTQLANSTGAPASANVWTTNFYGGFTYNTVDPFANNAYPLIENHIATDPAIQPFFQNNNVAIGSAANVDWNSFMKEIIFSNTYYSNSQSAAFLPIYRYLNKRNMFMKWVFSPNGYCGNFNGICYGFAGTSAMHYVDDTYLASTFNIGANTNLSSYGNSSMNEITAIQRVYLRQFEPSLSMYGVDKAGKVLPWSGLYRYKHVWPAGDSTKFRQLYVGWHSPNTGPINFAYHSILPYKIKTPQKLPFLYNNVQQYDTIYIYDSNNPTSQNEYFLIKSDKVNNPIDSVFSPSYSPAPNSGFFVAFNEVSVAELMGVSNSALKKSRSLDSMAKLILSPKSNYMIKDVATLNTTFYDATGYNNNNATVLGIAPKSNSGVHISNFFRDTLAELQISSTNYLDSIMNFTFDNDLVRMSLIRRAQPSETDNATSKNRYMSYGNPDNISKTLVADFSQIDPGLPTACIITLSNLVLPGGDSIITLNPADYQYQIIHPGNTNMTYNLNVMAIYNDTVKQFTASNVDITGQTSHIIDPYFNGGQGLQTAVIIDNGMNGSNDDTLFVLQVPLGIDEHINNADYISLYPNPTQNKFHVKIAKQVSETYQILLTDLYGRIILNEHVNHKTGTNSYAFDISKQSAGMYFVMVLDKNKKSIFMEKLVKE